MRQILHISDIHFGPYHLPEVADGVLDLVARRRPDLVVISGDLTQRAKPRQFVAAREFVDRIAAPTITVPGNHDVPMYRFWERLLAPYGAYRRHFSEQLEPTVRDEEMLVVGVNTAYNWTIKDGRITRRRLRRLAEVLADAPAGLTRIVVAHHELIPAPRFDTQRVLANAYETVEVLARLGADLVLSGHLHQAWVGNTESYYPSGRRPVLLVHAGTTTSSRGRGMERKRNTCNWIRVERDDLTVSHLTWDPAVGYFVESSRHRFPRRHRRPYGLETM